MVWAPHRRLLRQFDDFATTLALIGNVFRTIHGYLANLLALTSRLPASHPSFKTGRNKIPKVVVPLIGAIVDEFDFTAHL